MVQLRIQSGAAHWAALLFVALLISALAVPAEAKVRVDRLRNDSKVIDEVVGAILDRSTANGSRGG